MKNVKKLASILPRVLNAREMAFCDLDIFMKTFTEKKWKCNLGILCYNSNTDRYGTNFLKWSQQYWNDFIRQKAKESVKEQAQFVYEITAVRLSFCLKSNPTTYRLEITDLSNAISFNRVVIPKGPHQYFEYYLSDTEQNIILGEGASAIVKIVAGKIRAKCGTFITDGQPLIIRNTLHNPIPKPLDKENPFTCFWHLFT